MANPLAGISQSNLWFGKVADLKTWGPRSGWGGVWRHDTVKAHQPSDPFLIAGFENRTLHLAHQSDTPVTFTLEIDAQGNGQWRTYKTLSVPAKGYVYHVFPKDLAAEWIRVQADKECMATAYFHYASPRDASRGSETSFAALAGPGEKAVTGILRPGKDKKLQYVTSAGYYEMDDKFAFTKGDEAKVPEIQKRNAIKQDEYRVDAASVILVNKQQRYRLPKTDPAYDTARDRCIRECESERYLMNIHGTIYEMGRQREVELIKPICTHLRQIHDFCTWRGLLVLSGTRREAQPDGRYFASADGKVGLWFGSIDDLWRLGKPTGHGGPWKATAVQSGQKSDPYLMTGYDVKTLELSHDAAQSVTFTVEVNIDHSQWGEYQQFTIPAGKTITHRFPDGFNAHWVRVTADKECKVTAQLNYE